LLEQSQLFERTDTIEARRRRQIDRARQFGIRDPRVLLQLVEDADVDAVETPRIRGHSRNIPESIDKTEYLHYPKRNSQLEQTQILRDAGYEDSPSMRASPAGAPEADLL
jgi:hypothetical protein